MWCVCLLCVFLLYVSSLQAIQHVANHSASQYYAILKPCSKTLRFPGPNPRNTGNIANSQAFEERFIAWGDAGKVASWHRLSRPHPHPRAGTWKKPSAWKRRNIDPKHSTLVFGDLDISITFHPGFIRVTLIFSLIGCFQEGWNIDVQWCDPWLSLRSSMVYDQNMLKLLILHWQLLRVPPLVRRWHFLLKSSLFFGAIVNFQGSNFSATSGDSEKNSSEIL